MKKIIESLIVYSFIVFLILFCFYFHIPNIPKEKKYNWNHGYCEIDGGKLRYIGTNNKENYQCEKCGKIYKFNKVMSYKGE